MVEEALADISAESSERRQDIDRLKSDFEAVHAPLLASVIEAGCSIVSVCKDRCDKQKGTPMGIPELLKQTVSVMRDARVSLESEKPEHPAIMDAIEAESEVRVITGRSSLLANFG